MAEKPIPSDIANLSFEEALHALEEIVRQLEGGQVHLDEAVAAYEQGSLLKRHCEQRLAGAKAKIERITVSSEGIAAGTRPFEAERGNPTWGVQDRG